MERSSPHRPITARDNKTVKLLASLADAKVRKRERAFLIEGIKMVEDALRSGAAVRRIVASPSLLERHGAALLKAAERSSVEILWISDRLLDSLSENKTPQPVMAEVEMPEYAPETLPAGPAGLIIACHRLQDPGNLGTIIRTAEAAGASGVALSQNTVDPYNAKTVRASMGGILRLPVVRIADLKEFLQVCAKAHFQSAALTLKGEKTLFELDLRKPTVLLVGQEGAGLPPELEAAADHRVRIPMAASVESLNAAVSAAVVLYEAVRQRALPA